MNFLGLKRSKILALMVVFSMLFSCGVALGDNDNLGVGEDTQIVVSEESPNSPEVEDNETESEITDNQLSEEIQNSVSEGDTGGESEEAEESKEPAEEPGAKFEIPLLNSIGILGKLQSVAIISVAKIEDITIELGKNQLNLPKKVTVTLNDENKPVDELKVDWDNGTPEFDYNVPGEYIFTGALKLTGNITNPQNLTAEVKVIVAAKDENTLTVYLHSPHVNASSKNFETDPDDDGLTEPVVWHFVLNQIDNNGYLTLRVKFESMPTYIDVPASTNHKTNPVQHFYIGTANHDTLEDAYVEGVIAKNQNEPKLVLSHVRINGNPGGNEEEPLLGSVEVIKTISTTGEPQAGVYFTLTPKQDEVQPVALMSAAGTTIATNEEGIALFEGLEPGNYILTEEVPAGYMTDLPPEGQVVTVTAGETSTVYVENTPLGSVKVTKLISTTEEPQAGIKFELRRIIEEARSLINALTAFTNELGIALFENLEPGEYKLYEDVPKEYSTSLNDENRTITVLPGETTEVFVFNTPIEEEPGSGGPGGGEPGENPGENPENPGENPGQSEEPNNPGGSGDGGSSEGSDNTVIVEPEPTAVAPDREQELQVLPEPVAVEPEQEIEVQPEATATGPELPRTGGSALALIFGSLAAGSGILLVSRSRKEEK